MAWTSNIDLIQKLYIAFYGRPADPGGLRYWASQLPDNATPNSAATRELISRFINSQEAQERFGSPSLNSTIVRVYTYAFRRDATDADKAKYAGKTVVDVLVDVLSVSYGPDYGTLNEKLQYAKWFTNYLDPNGDGIPNDDSTGTKFAATFYGNTDAETAKSKLHDIWLGNPAVQSKVLDDVRLIADTGDYIITNPPVTGQTFTLTSSSAILTESTSNGVTPAGKLTSANDTIDALNLLSSNVVIKDPSASDNDTMRVILTAAVAPLVQNIENIELTVTNAAADLQMTNIIGTKNVVLKGDSTTNGKVSGLPTSGGPTIVLDSGYNQTLTLAQTTDAGSNDSLTVQLKGTGSKAGLTINDGTAGGALETLNLEAAGSAASTLTVSVDGTNTTKVVNTKVTGSQNLTLIAAANNLLSGTAKFEKIDATGHTGQLTLQIGANPTTPGVADASINLTDYKGVDRVVLNANTVVNVIGAASGIVVDANSDTAFASLTISGNSTVAATASNADVATLNLTSKTGAIISGPVTFTGFETLIINSTNVNHTITGALTTAGSPTALDTVKIGGNKDLTLGAAPVGVEKIDATGFTGKLIMTAAGAEMLEIVGGDGNDTIYGGGNSSSATIVNMGKGDDTYVFGAQSDVVTGGDGADTFDASTLANTILVSGVADKIMDFTSGVDKIKVGATIDGNTTNTTLAVQTLMWNTDLATTLTNGLTAIAANTAYFVKISGGTYDGAYFLILNDNNVGFQAGSDGVIQIIGSTTITADDIIA